MLPMVIDAKNELAAIIAERDIRGNFFIVPATDNLVADQREYAFPDDVLNALYSVEAAFTTATPLDYVLLLPDDFRRWGVGRTENNIIAHYSNSKGNARMEIQRRSIYILSGTIIAVTGGLRIRYRAYPADPANMTDNANDLSLDPTTTTFGFPKQFHELWARRVSIEWKGSRPKPIPLSPLEAKYEVDLEKMIQAVVDPNMSGETIGALPSDDGSQY